MQSFSIPKNTVSPRALVIRVEQTSSDITATDIDNNRITAGSGGLWVDGMKVQLVELDDGAAPTGATPLTDLYVVGARPEDGSFQLSATLGGSALTLTAKHTRRVLVVSNDFPFATASAVAISYRRQAGTTGTWSGTITHQDVTHIEFRHAWASGELPNVERIACRAVLTGTSGDRACGPFELNITEF